MASPPENPLKLKNHVLQPPEVGPFCSERQSAVFKKRVPQGKLGREENQTEEITPSSPTACSLLAPTLAIRQYLWHSRGSYSAAADKVTHVVKFKAVDGKTDEGEFE